MSSLFLPLLSSLLLFPAALLQAQHANPGELLTAKFGAGGTWNLYMPAEKALPWIKAQEFAAEQVDPKGGTGKNGHLVTISSGAENQFAYHFLRGSVMWIGLTDDEKFPGASEAGSSPHKGWAWVTGEPFTWSNWQTAQPTDDCEIPLSRGEDGVAIEANGFWNDRPHGGPDQPGAAYPFLIEWDVQSKDPVPGARVIGAVLPEKWPELKENPGTADHPWVCVRTDSTGSDPRMYELVKLLTDNWDKWKPFHLDNLCFLFGSNNPPGPYGWMFQKPPGTGPDGGATQFGMLARARLVIPHAGTYTFNVHADDAFALRLGTNVWKSACGLGGINPVNPATLHTLLMASDADTRGVIDLPAGEVPVEVFYINGSGAGQLQIFTAEGTYPLDGSTNQWRLLGHKAVANKVPWPGITADGWKVVIPPPGEAGKITRREQIMTSLMRVDETAAVAVTGIDSINFQDPDCSRAARFPGAVPFPNDPAGPQDDRVVLAEATLDIPADGLYHFGISGDDLCALQIAGQKWERIVRDASARFAKLDGDSISCRRCDNNTSMEIAGEIKLAQGRYSLRAFSWDRNGNSVLQIFACPSGWTPRLLAKNGAAVEQDLPGLEIKPFQP